MKNITLVAALLSLGVRLLCGQVLTAPSTEDSGAIQRRIDEAAKEGQPQVVIAPGVYRLKGNADAKTHLNFEHVRNLEIVGTGVTLVFTDRTKNAIRFKDCRAVTLRGFTLRREPMPFSQGHVVAVNDDSVDIKVSAGYPADVDNERLFPSACLNLYDANHHWLANTPKNERPNQKLSAETFRYFPARNHLKGDPAWGPGASVAWRGRGGPDIGIDNCSAMKIVGVTIQNGSGFCVREADGEGGNYYNYIIARGPKPAGATEDPILASNADGFHSYAVRHGPTLENCHFEAMDDDGIAIHGKYGLVERSQGNDVVIRAGKKRAFARIGDTIRFNDDRGVFAAEGKVTAVAGDIPFSSSAPPPAALREFQDEDDDGSGFTKVTLDHPPNAKFGWLAANANASGDGFAIRNCSVRYNRARGFLIKASDGVIENCAVEGSTAGGIVVSPEQTYWDESDFSRHVIIRNNTLTNEATAQKDTSPQVGALSIMDYEYGHFVPLPGGHRDILVEGNTFVDNDGPQIMVTSAQGVTIRNNRFLRPMMHQNPRGSALGVNSGALIWLTQCSGIQISGNAVSNPGRFLKTLIDSSVAASGTGFKDGVIRQ